MVCGTGSLVLSRLLAFGIAVAGLLVLAPLAIRRHGRTGAQALAARIMWWRGRRRRQHLYLTGLASPVSLSHRLPGILAKSQLWEVETGLREPLGVVVIPQSRHYSISLSCQTDGMDLVDQPVVDQRVARLAGFLAALCRETWLVQAQVTVESTPDQGGALANEVASTTAAEAPPLAASILEEIVRTYPLGAAQVDTWVTLTFTPPRNRRWTHENVCMEISAKLPALVMALQGAGASGVTPMSAEQLCAQVASAFDPAGADRAMMRRTPSWDNAGPVAAFEMWDHYRHDSAYSRTWGMVEAPRGTVYSSAFSRLSDPDPGMLRKRVSIIYRPYTPPVAAGLVERDRKDALFTANKKRTATARDSLDVLAAEQAAHEEATGAGMTRFTVLVTATVRERAELYDAEARIQARAGEARMVLRCMHACQAATFAANLPTGIVLPAHASLPVEGR
jgi:hypothetical protein